MMMGSTRHKGNAPLMTKDQKALLSQILAGQGPQANQAISQLLQPGQDMEAMQQMYQQAFIDPAMLAYEQDILPAIQQRFGDANAGSSSALNQALARSAADLSTMLSGQMGQYAMHREALNQQGQLGGLGVLQNTLSQRAFEPIIQQRQGLMGPLLGMGGQIAGGALGGYLQRPGPGGGGMQQGPMAGGGLSPVPSPRAPMGVPLPPR